MMTEAKKPSLKEKLDSKLDREFHNPIPQAICSGIDYIKELVCKPPKEKKKETNV